MWDFARSSVLGAFILTMAAVANGQQYPNPITFAVGPGQPVAGGPQFVAVADLNNDGFGDAIVTTERDEELVALLSAGDGTLAASIPFSLGHRLGDIATGDFDADGNQDVTAIDERGGVVTIAGIGDGRFNGPVFHEGTLGSAAIAVADVDQRDGLDIVTANGADNSVSVFLNRGGNRGFKTSIEYAVGGRFEPVAIEAADFNSDGFPDIAVIGTNPDESGEVRIMINNGQAQYLEVFSFVVDDRVVALTSGDFNDDGTVDIATVNEGDLTQTRRKSYTVSVLLNDGDAGFNVLLPLGGGGVVPERARREPIQLLPKGYRRGRLQC